MVGTYVFLTFVLRLMKTPEKTQKGKPTRPAIEPGPARREATMLALDHLIIILIFISVLPKGQVLHCKLRHQGCNSAQRQVINIKLRNQAFSFTKDE